MARIVITGGCGFIGSNLCRLLLEQGHQLTVLDNLSRGSEENLADFDVPITRADILDTDACAACFAGHDALVHLAAYGSVVESVQDPDENFEINVRGTFNVLKAAQAAGIRRMVFSSTGGAIMGDAPLPVDETSVPRPISPYGASKLAGEGYCSAFAASYDMSITALRFANVIGPNSWHKKGAVTAFCKAVMNGQAIEIYGDGSATRDFLYVDDLCAGIMAALDAKLDGFNVFHLASEDEVSVKELAEKIKNISGNPDHEILFHDSRKGEVQNNFASSRLASQVLGFKPRYGIDEGLRLTWEWMSKYSSQMQ